MTDTLAVPTRWDADMAVTALYSAHYRALVRLSTLMVRDTETAEEVVQDAFIALHSAWSRLRDTDKALAYLRQSVVVRSRSVLRHRAIVAKYAPRAPLEGPRADEGEPLDAGHIAHLLDQSSLGSAGARTLQDRTEDDVAAEIRARAGIPESRPRPATDALDGLERTAVIEALRNLPLRQREALVLRYYGDLSSTEIAKAMGISTGAVESHTARGMATLRKALQQAS
ncbi:sigma-70 family RNA polymerase sigma factor [Sphaerisporangium dianthi]|uniref:Sigma-70 family RNA polymerase sigma factor n=1 Tax=Sphaerisporangium dianthi TaxID=1436120 RepID=A0ABV9CSA3_9ACTN